MLNICMETVKPSAWMRRKSGAGLSYWTLCALLMLAGMPDEAKSATTSVCSVNELHTAASAASPGDVIKMCNGNWADAKIIFSVRGRSGKPIRLEAETPGQVILTGSSQLAITGKFAIVDGLTFQGEYTGTDFGIIRFQNDADACSDCRLTNTSVLEYSPPDSQFNTKWVIVGGARNRVDHCHFRGKTNLGSMLQVKIREYSLPNDHRIDHNFFENRPDLRSEQSQNGDTLEIGSISKYAFVESRSTVEYNYLLNIDSDYEIVTVKSSGNTLRHNVIDTSSGVFSLRQGTDNTVDGNFIFGRGRFEAGGIRVTGDGHKVVNNYIEDVDPSGVDSKAAISLSTGTSQTIIAGNNDLPYYHYEVAENVIVAHNTVINSGSGLLVGLGNNSVPPRNIDVRANLFYKINGSCAEEKKTGNNIRYADNVCNGGTNDANVPGFSNMAPQLNVDDRGIFRPSANSPIVNAISSPIIPSTNDMDGQSRSIPFDIGADEFTPGETGRGPISKCDVGPVSYRNSGGSCQATTKPPKSPTGLSVT